MADPRTFVLIGDFQDNITPALESINNSIAGLKRTMSTMTSKRGGGFSDVTQSVGKLVSAQIHLKEAIEGVGAAAKAATDDLKAYKNVVGKVASAHYHIQKSGTAAGKAQTKFWEGANNELNAYRRNMESLQKSTRIRNPATPYSRRQTAPLPEMRAETSRRGGGGGGGNNGGGGGGGGFHVGRGGVARDEVFAFGQTLGFTLSDIITGAITKGFEIGVQLMMAPFQYFANSFQERVQDQLDDLKAAGGLFSISKRSESPFLKTIDDAIDFQQETNATFAKMAGQLPGVTNDYVQVGKRLSDTMARVVFQQENVAGAIERANKIRATEEGRRFYGGEIKGTGIEAQKEAYKTLLGDMTKLTTLAGMGGTARGGTRGAYGIPALTERMMSEDEVSMAQMQRYASIFGDPMIADALERNIDKINATTKKGLARMDAIREMWQEILTPELVDKLRTSVDGIYQGIKSSLFDPDSGLFGLGREFEKFGKRMDSFGRYIDKTGKVVTNVNDAADANLSFFEILANIFSNTGQVLAPLIDAIRDIWDPLKGLSRQLMLARHYTGELARTFNEYREGLKLLAKQAGKGAIMDTLDLRAALAAINNLFLQFKVIDAKQFTYVAKTLQDASADPTKLVQPMVDMFLNSNIAEKIGHFLGTLIATVLTEVANMVDFIANKVGGNKLTSGFAKGFTDGKGFEAIVKIYQGIFKVMGEALMFLWENTPFKAKIIGIVALLIPAFAAGFVVAFANLLEGMFGAAIKALKKCKTPPMTGLCGIGGGPGGKPGGRPGAPGMPAGFVPSPAKPNVRTGVVANQTLRPVGPRPPEGFGHIALPGTAPAITSGVTASGKTPSIPKPIKPLTKPSFGALSSLKGKGVGLIASAMIGLAVKAPALAKAGKAVVGMAKSLPVLGVALTGVDFAMRKAGGQDTGKAAGGAIGAGVGGAVGASLGSMIPIPVLGTVLGGLLGSTVGAWIGESVVPFFQNLPATLSTAWQSTVAWFNNAPERFGEWLHKMWNGIANWWETDWPILLLNFQIWLDELGAALKKGLKKTIDKAAAWATDPTNWANLLKGITTGVMAAFNPMALVKLGFDLGTKILSGLKAGWDKVPTNGGPKVGDTRKLKSGKMAVYTEDGWVQQDATSSYGGSLGDAVASEMKNKPPGSDLVIANSSETVIPAAGGHGMMDFVETLRWGFVAMMGAFKEAQQKQDALLSNIDQTLKANQQATNAKLMAIEKKFTTPGVAGGLGGAAAGGVDAFTGMAQSYGLQMTSGYRPGDPGWHGANRARDFSNGTGPTPQMMAFAQFLASTYGSNLKELIYTPLGFSIKNGQRVAPYAQGSHYNHVHVAYAMGLGNGVAFSSLRGAQSWENSMVSGSVKVASVTGNSAEGFGGNTVGNLNVTVNAGSISDPDILADVVAQRILSEMQSDSIFV